MKNILTLSLLLICGLCFGQNLVPNPSFEEYDSCPTDQWQLYLATGWSVNVNTADYYNECADTSGFAIGFPVFSVPLNTFGFQYASTGDAYAGFMNISKNVLFQDAREYLGRELSVALIAGNKYYISFKVSLAENSDCATNKIGIRFTNVSFGDTTIQPPPLVDNFAHLYTDNIVRNFTDWTTISGSFVSDFNYNYFLIGNFFEYSNTDSVGSNCNAYYYVDDICISTDSLTCPTLVGVREAKLNTDVSFFPNPFSNQLTFKLATNEPTRVSLYDILGQQILQQTFTNSTTLNTAQMQAGIYFYELSNAKGTLKTGKIVKE